MKDANVNSSVNMSGGLKEREDKFRVIIESAPVGIGEISLEPPRFKWVNEATCKILEYTEEELLTMDPFDLIVEESQLLFRKRMKKILAGKKVQPSVDYKLKTKNGRLIWVNLNVNLLHRKGKAMGALIFAQDTTKRKKAEEELKESEERFFKAFQLNPTPMAIAFTDGEFTDVNCSFERLTGFRRDEVIGKHGVGLGMYGEASEREELIRKLQQEGHVYNFPMTLKTKSMKQVNVLFSLEQIKLQNKPRVLGAAIDVTEKEKLQNELEKYSRNLEELVKQKTEQLRETERLVAIGQTAGMVGHDIRNPLQAIVGDLYLASDDLRSIADSEEKDRVKESLMAIQKNVDYIEKIVSDLQDFVRPLKPMIGEVDLEGFVEGLLFKAELPENVEALCQVEENVKTVVSDEAFLERALGNLISNALQAMPDGGKLAVQAYREGDDVVIAVQDTGVGVAEESKGKLFTPLFTTKSKGQGFGLAVVKRLVESLGGSVSFESEEGRGSTFRISFPIVDRSNRH
jgi:PAS domain S-box-containing protein